MLQLFIVFPCTPVLNVHLMRGQLNPIQVNTINEKLSSEARWQHSEMTSKANQHWELWASGRWRDCTFLLLRPIKQINQFKVAKLHQLLFVSCFLRHLRPILFARLMLIPACWFANWSSQGWNEKLWMQLGQRAWNCGSWRWARKMWKWGCECR